MARVRTPRRGRGARGRVAGAGAVGGTKRRSPAVERRATQTDSAKSGLADESVQKLLQAIEQASNAILMTDPNGAITYVNPAFEKIYGYSSEETLGKTPRLLKSGQHDRAFYKSFWQRLLAGGSIQEEFINKTKDGRLVTVENYVSPVLDFRGERIGIIAVQNDITERKRVEKALRESEERFHRSFSASPVAMSLSEKDTGRMLDVNEGLSRMMGYEREELIGRTAVELGIWADASERNLMIQALPVRELEVHLRTKSGDVRTILDSVEPLRLGESEILLSVFQDVTDRKRAEKETRRSEERYRRLVDSNTIGIVITNLSGQVLEANDAYLNMVGCTRDELREGVIRWDNLTPPEYRAGDEAAVEQLRRTGIARSWEKEYQRKDETRVPVMIGIARLSESEGTCIAYIVDLTDRRRAEESLRDSEARYRFLFESNPQPMWVFDKNTLGFLAVNEAACEHYGYSREEFRGMTIEDIRPTEDVPALRRFLETESPSGVWKHRKKDGTLIDVEISSNPLILDGREAQLILASDVTERRLLEQQFRQAQKMEAVGQLAGGVAHDFNNLLTVILGYTDLVATEIEKGSRLAESLDEIRKAGERAASLTRQLLAFSRKQVLEPRVLDLNALVADLGKMLHRLIGEDVRLVTALDPGVGRIRADAGQIEQIILNLAVNARDSMPRGGQLTIETSNIVLDEGYAGQYVAVRAGTYVMLAMTDTGTGMTAETKAHMFEPFFTTKGLGKGTGLGLATVYGIVKQSKGYVWADSELNRGTTFKVYLPVMEGASLDSSPPLPDASHPNGSETVLLVEDEKAIRTLTRKILESYGYSVLEADSGEAAFEMARSHKKPIHLLLTDVVMPDVGGRDLAKRIATILPSVRVLFMSGYTDDAIVRQGILADRVNFIQKPFTPDALARKVRKVLDLLDLLDLPAAS